MYEKRYIYQWKKSKQVHIVQVKFLANPFNNCFFFIFFCFWFVAFSSNIHILFTSCPSFQCNSNMNALLSIIVTEFLEIRGILPGFIRIYPHIWHGIQGQASLLLQGFNRHLIVRDYSVACVSNVMLLCQLLWKALYILLILNSKTHLKTLQIFI